MVCYARATDLERPFLFSRISSLKILYLIYRLWLGLQSWKRSAAGALVFSHLHRIDEPVQEPPRPDVTPLVDARCGVCASFTLLPVFGKSSLVTPGSGICIEGQLNRTRVYRVVVKIDNHDQNEGQNHSKKVTSAYEGIQGRIHVVNIFFLLHSMLSASEYEPSLAKTSALSQH